MIKDEINVMQEPDGNDELSPTNPLYVDEAEQRTFTLVTSRGLNRHLSGFSRSFIHEFLPECL